MTVTTVEVWIFPINVGRLWSPSRAILVPTGFCEQSIFFLAAFHTHGFSVLHHNVEWIATRPCIFVSYRLSHFNRDMPLWAISRVPIGWLSHHGACPFVSCPSTPNSTVQQLKLPRLV